MSSRKYRRDNKPSLRERAINLVRRHFDSNEPGPRQLLAAARALIRLAQNA